MYQRTATAYRDTEILGSSREQLVPLLYRHLLAALRKASGQIREGDIEGKSESLTRASDIVYELLGSLNHEAGGEMAERLSALYGYFLTEIREAGRTLDAPRLEGTLSMVDSLHGAWAEAATRVVAERSSGALGPGGVGA